MKRVPSPPAPLPPGVYPKPGGGHYARVKVGASATSLRDQRSFGPEVSIPAIVAWQEQARKDLLKRHRAATPGSLAASVVEYLRLAQLSKANRERREQQLAWWCAQPAKLGAPVFSVKEVLAAADAGTALTKLPTLGAQARSMLDLKRVREVLAIGFAPTNPNVDPTEHAGTSNHYRMALYHLFSVLDQDEAQAVNPIAKVKVRPLPGAQLAGQDMRIVREVLKHVPTRFGRSSRVSELRLAVLAWVHITPKQLQQVDPPRHFHDVPNATREEIIGGVVTLTKPPRLKGRLKRIPPPETIPLNPWGVEAMRAFAAERAAWGTFSVPPLNRMFKRGCRKAQAALARQGVNVDLSAMTLYHLKHSLATAAQLASAGIVDRAGRMRQSPGVQRALDHASARTTAIYTQAAVDPAVRYVSAATAVYLDHLFTMPLVPPPTFTVVPKTGSDL